MINPSVPQPKQSSNFKPDRMLSSGGSLLIGLCPFHSGTEPQFRIDPRANTWSCVGACNTSGTALDFVMRGEGVSRRHALELLATGGPAPVVKRRGGRLKTKEGPSHSTVRRLPSPVDPGASDTELLAQVVAYYHETLKQSPEALAFLEQRGLRSPEVIDTFKLGFSNRTLGYRLPMKNRQAGAEIRSRLQRLGVLRDTGHEHFRGSLVVPVFNEQNQVVQMYGRKVTEGLRAGTALHVSLPEHERGLWNVGTLQAMSSVILCQSVLDGLSVWCAGYRNVVATLGHDAFTGEHAATLKAKGIEKVLIAYRRDAGGDAAADAVAEKLMAHGLSCYRVKFLAGMDANDFVVRHQPASKALGSVLRNASWMGKGKQPTDDLESAGIAVVEEPPAELRRSPPPMETSSRPPRRRAGTPMALPLRVLPVAFTRARPARTRSRISSRSNSARAAMRCSSRLLRLPVHAFAPQQLHLLLGNHAPPQGHGSYALDWSAENRQE